MKMSALRTVAATTLLALGMVASFAGFTQSAVAESPDVYMQKLLHDVGEGNGSALWSALPEDYQDDVHDVIAEFADKMDAELWNGTFKTLGKLTKVLKDKKEFILGSSLAATMPADKKEELKKNWDSMVAGLDALVTSDIKTLEGLKELDVGDYLKDTGNKLVKDLVAAGVQTNPQAAEGLDKFKKAKVTLVSKDGDNAVLKLETEGEEPKEEKFTQVDGKWLPTEMVEGWDDGIAKAKASLKALAIPPEQKAQVMLLKNIADGVLDQLAAAKDQAAFDQALQGVMALVPGMGGPPGAAKPIAPPQQ